MDLHFIKDDQFTRKVRFFISSTFLDMQQERDAIVQFVFPKVREKLRARNIQVTEIDLRWGITKEQAESGRILPICFDEIDRCRPYFIAILGDRYGTSVPMPEAMRNGLDALNLPFECSMTEYETRYFLSQQLPPEISPILFMREDATDSDRPNLKNSERDEQQRKQKQFRQFLLSQNLEVRNYRTIQEFSERLIEDIVKTIDGVYPEDKGTDLFTVEANEHLSMLYRNIENFVDGGSYNQELATWISSKNGGVCVVYGEEGVGKTTLLAKALTKVEQDDAVLSFFHHSGLGGSAANYDTLTRRIREWSRRVTGDNSFEINVAEMMAEGEEDFAERFAEKMVRLAHDQDIGEEGIKIGVSLSGRTESTAGTEALLASAAKQVSDRNQRMLMMVDGIDAFQVKNFFSWVPDPVPENLKIIVSSRSSQSLQVATQREWHVVNVRPLSQSDLENVISHEMRRWGRTLSEFRIAAILENKNCTNPRFLTQIINQLRLHAIESNLDQQIERLANCSTLAEVAHYALDVLEDQIGRELVSEILATICVSRNGLTEPEVLQITKCSPLDWSRIQTRLNYGLHAYNEFFKVQDGSLKEAIEDRYLSSTPDRTRYSEKLAQFFKVDQDKTRRSQQYPFHLMMAGHKNELREFLESPFEYPSLVKSELPLVNELWRYLGLTSEQFAELISRKFASSVRVDRGLSSEESEIALSLIQLFESVGIQGKSYLRISEIIGKTSEDALDGEVSRSLVSNDALSKARLINGDLKGAKVLLERSLAVRTDHFGRHNSDTIRNKGALAVVNWQEGRHDQAESLFQEAYKDISSETKDIRNTEIYLLNNYGIFLSETGQFSEAVRVLERSHELTRHLEGDFSTSTLSAAVRLGTAYRELGDARLGRTFLEKTLKNYKLITDHVHHGAMTCMKELIICYLVSGEVSLAEGLAAELVAAIEDLPEVVDEETNKSLLNIGLFFYRAKSFQIAMSIESRVANSREQSLGKEHPLTLLSFDNLACSLMALRQPNEAREIFQWVSTSRETVLGADHPETLQSFENFSQCLLMIGDFSEAHRILVTLYGNCKEWFGLLHMRTLNSALMLAQAKGGLGDWEKAAALLDEEFAAIEGTAVENHIVYGMYLKTMAEAARHCKRVESAVDLEARFVAWREEMNIG